MAMFIKRVLIAVLLLCLPTLSHAWWNKDWKQRERVELNTSAQGADTKEALTGVVLAVRLHMGNFSFTDAKPDGSDLRFVAADDKTVLKHVVERFDAANGLAVLWVQVPTIAANNAAQSVWLYHGNPKAASISDGKTVFDAGTVVFNFSEDGAAIRDAGQNGIVPTQKPAVIEPAGLLGGSAVLKGEPLVLPDAPALHHPAGGTFSISLWLKPGAAASKATIYRQAGLALSIDANALVLKIGGKEMVRGGQIKPELWQHVGVAVSSGRAALYLNGAEVASDKLGLPELAGEVSIGEGLTGQIDAVQIASSGRSADWFKLAAKSQGIDGNFPQVVAEAEESGGGHSYFGILIDNLTPDAWGVIGVLGVMFVVALLVMVFKAQFITRVEKANRRFLKRFRAAEDDFTNIAKDRAYRHSSLFLLYEAGVRELHKRHLGGSVGSAAVALSGASVNAIKAAIDADMVRETHRLNARMVLLTIAISGGPFLGLLGTVVGVMITFAAIAAAGDVNVNAIAPGIAAALLATVAGLGVAIPSLFGYNYLASRIKTISADMQIFVDELVTRIAEQYGV